MVTVNNNIDNNFFLNVSVRCSEIHLFITEYDFLNKT